MSIGIAAWTIDCLDWMWHTAFAVDCIVSRTVIQRQTCDLLVHDLVTRTLINIRMHPMVYRVIFLLLLLLLRTCLCACLGALCVCVCCISIVLIYSCMLFYGHVWVRFISFYYSIAICEALRTCMDLRHTNPILMGGWMNKRTVNVWVVLGWPMQWTAR